MDFNNESISLTSIEMKIKTDKDGSFKKETLELLESQIMQVKANMDSGLSPSEFKQQTQLKDAIGCAVQVIQKLWENHHRYIGKSHTLRYSK